MIKLKCVNCGHSLKPNRRWAKRCLACGKLNVMSDIGAEY